MRRLSLLLSVLLLLSVQESRASDTDDPDGGQRLQSVTASSDVEGSNLLERDEQQVIIRDAPVQKCRGCTPRQKQTTGRIARVVPPLMFATIGTVVALTTDQRVIPPFLTRDWGDTFPYTEFFFPTARLGVQKLGDMWQTADFNSLAYYVGLTSPAKIVVSFLVPGAIAVGEIMRALTPTRYYGDEDTVSRVKARYIGKGLLMGGIGTAGAMYLWWSSGMWNQIFTYYGPRVIQEFNLTGAIDFFVNANRYMGINEIWLSVPCAPENLKFYLIPSANGLPWSYSQPLLYILSAAQQFELSIPLLMLVLNLIYMVAWI